MNTVKGHALAREGAVAYGPHGHFVSPGLPVPLHARCECGALSEPGISRSAAKRWHRQHKQQVREQETT